MIVKDLKNCSEASITAIIICSNTSGKLHHLTRTLSALKAHQCTNIIFVYDTTIDGAIPEEFLALLDQYKNFNYKLMQGSYGSPGMARNAGLEVNQTKFTVFWDYDDEPVVDVLCRASLNTKESTDVVIFDYLEYDEKTGQLISKVKSSSEAIEIAKRPGIWRMLFRTDKINGTKFRHLSMGEDQIFLEEFGLMKKEIETIGSVGYVYSRNFPGSLTTTRKRIDHLRTTVGIIESRIDKSASESENFRIGLLARQLISLLKYGPFRNRLFALLHLLRFIVTSKHGIKKLISSII